MIQHSISYNSSSGDALLTNSIVHVLRKYKEDKKLNEEDIKTIAGGKYILEKIIEGATLIETDNYQQDFSPTQESLHKYSYALSTLNYLCKKDNSTKAVLEPLFRRDEYLGFFQDLLKYIQYIDHKRKIKRNDVSLLLKFFIALRNTFINDVRKGLYEQPDKEFSLP